MTRALLFAVILACPLLAVSDDPASVLVVVNDAVPAQAGTGGVGASVWLGQYYASVRNIPAGNIVHTNSAMGCCSSDPASTDSWEVPYATFAAVRQAIYTHLTTNGLKNSIRYIVCIYGVPSHFTADGTGDLGHGPNGFGPWSVDSFLANMWYNYDVSPYYKDILQTPNLYYQSSSASTPPRFKTVARSWPMYLVTRLDGPTLATAKALVDNAALGEAGIGRKSGTGYFDWQGNSQTAGNDSLMYRAHTACVAANMKCTLNNQSTSGGMISNAPNALWAWGWYSANGVNDVYTFAPGAVGAQYTSYTCQAIRYANGGSWCHTFVLRGITATWGAANEPGSNYASGHLVLPRLWAGLNFAEAFYSAVPVNGHMMIAIGDPLYSPSLQGPSTVTGNAQVFGRATIQ